MFEFPEKTIFLVFALFGNFLPLRSRCEEHHQKFSSSSHLLIEKKSIEAMMGEVFFENEFDSKNIEAV